VAREDVAERLRRISAAEARKTGLELAPRLEDHLASAIWAAAERMEAEQRLAESDYEEARKGFDAVFARAAEDIKEAAEVTEDVGKEFLDDVAWTEAINGLCPGLWPFC
jgi:hypothetical protein